MTKRKKSEGFVEEFGKGFAELVKFFSYKPGGLKANIPLISLAVPLLVIAVAISFSGSGALSHSRAMKDFEARVQQSFHANQVQVSQVSVLKEEDLPRYNGAKVKVITVIGTVTLIENIPFEKVNAMASYRFRFFGGSKGQYLRPAKALVYMQTDSGWYLTPD